MWIFAKALSVRNLLKKKELRKWEINELKGYIWDSIDYCSC